MAQKKALIKACLKKVNSMASNATNLRNSALAKLKEFQQLGYPKSILKQICNYVATTTGNGKWINIRNDM